jgi:hypothetical protein
LVDDRRREGEMTDNFKENYFRALRLPARSDDPAAEVAPIPPGHGVDPVALKAALDRAHELRKFEIENYWKRSSYFWVFQFAAFTLSGFVLNILKASNGGLDAAGLDLLLIPAVLGAATALVGLRTARGSKFWQENWEAHVDALEPLVEGRLTQVIVGKSRRASVSRINERLYGLLLAGWVLLFVIVLFRFRLAGLAPFVAANRELVGLLSLGGAFVLLSWGVRTRLRGWRLASSGWKPIIAKRDAKDRSGPVLHLRHPAGGENDQAADDVCA